MQFLAVTTALVATLFNVQASPVSVKAEGLEKRTLFMLYTYAETGE